MVRYGEGSEGVFRLICVMKAESYRPKLPKNIPSK